MESIKNGLQIAKGYNKHIKVMVLIMFLVHGVKLNASVIGIDTEALIFYGGKEFYQGWLNTGRQGLVLLKYLFRNIYFNPYFSAVLTLLVFPLAVSAFFLLWSYAGGVKKLFIVWIIGGLLWISHPILTEQFYFSLQSFEIALGFLLTAAALYLTSLWIEKKRCLWAFGASAALLIITFSIYQAFVAFYIFGAVSVLFFQTLREFSRGKQGMAVGALARTGGYFVVFITAFLINTVITELFFDNSGYLSEQMFWGTAPIGKIIWSICGHILSVLVGRSPIFYSPFYGCFLICSVVLFAAYLHQYGRKNKSGCITVSFFYLALQSSPFIMTFLQGGEPVLRSQLILPAMTGLQAMLCLWLLQDLTVSAKTAGRVILAGIMFLGLLGGARTTKITWGFYYTDQLRYEQDVTLGNDLIQRLEVIFDREETSLPVVIVGTRPFQRNNSCIQGQVMGQSIFDWDASVAPIPYWSTRRVVGFLHVLGANYSAVSMDRLEEALTYSENMAEWPAEDCVQMYNGMVIIKLSEPPE
ncbi:MAG: glucosyltransferase domain-containing protein [Acetatifactor sp.]|nr:glucosyltransferase domain-containing protein [Acetatifactor sp.]